MVFFSCDGCGEVLKKNQVEAHAHQRCRNCASVSCVDCNVSFYGDDYRMHTTCISESERYEKTDRKVSKKTKRSPQELWMDLVQSAVETAPVKLKHYLQKIAALDNIPRKEKQFRNFAANSLNLHGGTMVQEIWNYLAQLRREEQQKQQQQQEQQQEQEEIKNETDNLKTEGKATDNGYSVSDKETVVKKQSETAVPDPKSVKKAMKKLLKKAKDRSLSMKLLRAQVLQKLNAPDSAKKSVKKIIRENCAKDTEIFSLQGKTVSLKVD